MRQNGLRLPVRKALKLTYDNDMETKVTDFQSIIIKLASPERVRGWSFGEVTKPETINYRTQRPERDGLFDERIFGPEKDYECYCGKYRRIRYKGIVCDRCGVEVTRSIVRRERMGHIELASPVAHIWFLRGVPSRIGMLLNLSVPELERVIYFAGYVIVKVNEEHRSRKLKELEKEYKMKVRGSEREEEKTALKGAADQARGEIRSLEMGRVLGEVEYHHLSMRYGDIFEAGIGAEALLRLTQSLNLEEMRKRVEVEVQEASALAQRKLLRRLNLIKSLERSGVKPEWMFLNIIPVMPPALRPMVQLDGGRHATSDVNDLYRRVINRNNRLKKLLDLRAPEVIVRNEKRMLQEAVDALIDNSIRRGQGGTAVNQAQKRPLRSLADMLKGKQGRFRQNLLGKRVDYSGRSVIVVGPQLKLHQCGLPKHMALELFRPFVIAQLINQGFAHNIKGANRVIEEATPEVWAILEDVTREKYVLLNRAPTLHRLGIQAFQPVLIEGNAIQIHPLVCSAFNADFDGDQMAVHVPLTHEAQWEAKHLMLSTTNLTKPGTGTPVVNPTQDMVLGIYWLTRLREGMKGEGKIFASPNEAILAHEFDEVDLRANIRVRVTRTERYAQYQEEGFLNTTVGRLLFNSVLPNDFTYLNEEVKRKTLERIIEQLIRRYGAESVPPILDKIKDFGFRYSMRSGISWGLDDLVVPKEKAGLIKEAQKEIVKVEEQYNEGMLTNEERYRKIIGIWSEVKRRVDEAVPRALDEHGPVHSMVSSAARGSWLQVSQMSGMKGLVLNPSGRIIELPVLSSFKEGLTVLEYFISTHAARKGTADTALKTSAAGYLTRRLVDVAQDVIVCAEDCGNAKGLRYTRAELSAYENYGRTISVRLFGRTLAKDVKDEQGKVIFRRNHILSAEDARKMEGAAFEEIYLRSPITCTTLRGVCRLCYGYDLGSLEYVEMGAAVGIVAAQAIGEPGTQLTMRTFHTGGVASAADITAGLPHVEEIFELRAPKHPAILCTVAGTVVEVKEADSSERIVAVITDPGQRGSNKDRVEFIVPFGRTILFKEGDAVTPGDALTDGGVDIQELYRISGAERAQKYILEEISKVYTIQGASISDKHVEVIVRQIFSRILIAAAGQTKFSQGEIIELADFSEENQRIQTAGGEAAKGNVVIMGITRVALTTSSFLSAASFQETARVLISAALDGREDRLRGLKENVIIGHLIPAGTGFRARSGVSFQTGEMPDKLSVSEETE